VNRADYKRIAELRVADAAYLLVAIAMQRPCILITATARAAASVVGCDRPMWPGSN